MVSVRCRKVCIIAMSSSVFVRVGYDPTVYTTSEGEGMVELNIFVFSHPATGAPRPFTLSISTQDGIAGMLKSTGNINVLCNLTAVSPDDYGGVSGQIIPFNTGDTKQTHTITITQDRICEKEYILSNTLLVSGMQLKRIHLKLQARVFINDTKKDPVTGQSCGKISII